MKVLLVVLVVAGVSAVCVYTMALTNLQIEQRESVSIQPSGSSTRPGPDTAKLLDTESEEPPAESSPPGTPVQEEKPPAEMPPPKETASQPVTDDSFDPLLGESFNEALISSGTPRDSDLGSPRILATGSTAEEAVKNRDILRIEKQAKKMEKGLNKKLNTIASKLKLDPRTREDLLAISRDGLSEVVEIRKQFAGRAMTGSERAYMRDQVKTANANTAENIRRLLGGQFKDYRQESKYYDNPNQRVLDKMKDIEKQNRDLQRKIEQQNRRRKKSRPDGSKLRNLRPR
jgi:hypothetical protein